jgi:DNA primase
VVEIPQGKDPDESVREDPILFKKAVTQASPIYDYFIKSAQKRFDIKSAFGKKKMSEELIPILAKIENPIVQSHYIKILAKILDVDEQVIDDSIKRVKKNTYTVAKENTELGNDKLDHTRPEKLEIYVLGLILQTKTREYLEEFLAKNITSDLNYPGVKQILDLLVKYLVPNNTFLIKDFADSLPKELLPIFDEAYLWDISDISDNAESVAQEWVKVIQELRKVILKNKIKILSQQFGNGVNESGDLQKEISELTQELRGLEKNS